MYVYHHKLCIVPDPLVRIYSVYQPNGVDSFKAVLFQDLRFLLYMCMQSNSNGCEDGVVLTNSRPLIFKYCYSAPVLA